jgi:CHAT domain-containing protein/DUF2075 family protein
MDENRVRSYLNLIQLLLSCPSGEEGNVLQEHSEFVDSGLIEVMQEVASRMAADGEQNAAFLQQLAEQISQALDQGTQGGNADRDSAYLQLINALLSCPNGDEPQILSANSEFLDLGFMQACEAVAASLAEQGDENGANFLRNLASEVEKLRGFTFSGSNDIENKLHNDYLVFFQLLLQTEYENLGENSQQIYALLQANLDKLNLNLIPVIYRIARYLCRINEPEHTQGYTALIANIAKKISQFPLGSRAENQEIAITAYEIVLSVRTWETPEEWALTQHNLAIAYSNRIRGEKADNIERAIRYDKNALEVYRRETFPQYWAMTQNNLGEAYRKRIRGEKADNIESAIGFYTATLEIYSRASFPDQWAVTQNNLALAYSDKIRGEKAENIEMALRCYKDALEVLSREAFPQDWATTQNNLAISYSNRIRGERADNIERAIQCCKDALEVRSREAFPEQWAATQNNLAAAYSERIRGERAENIESAIASYTVALEVRTRHAFPEEWAATQNNLAIAYSERIRGESADNIEMAIAYFSVALEVYSRDAFPQHWAAIQNNLGKAYNDRIRGERADNIEMAIVYFSAALEVYSRDAFPEEWAMTQNNLGNAYRDRIRGERADNIEMAIAYFSAALEVRSREAFPQTWAATQRDLAIAYHKRIKGERADNIEMAIAFYTVGLEVYSRDAFPQHWAVIQNDLAISYNDRIRGERADNIERAIAFYAVALEIYKREAFPEDWAMTQNNLGNVYYSRIRGERADNIESAIEYFFAALEVRSHEAFPEQWAATQNNLAAAYYSRIMGERAENIEMAIASYTDAIEVYTRKAFPQNHAGTLFNLGLAYRKVPNLQLAYDTFADAINTVELLRGEIHSGDEIKQKLAEEWNKVYRNMVEVCIELKNYTAAIEYAERSKARNLVELLATRDLYPKGDIPETVINELSRLRREIDTEQRQLDIEQANGNSNGGRISGERSPQIDNLQTTIRDRSHLTQLRQQLNELIACEIKPIDPDFALTQEVKGISYSEIQSLTAENTAIFQWYITSDRLLAFIITPESPTPTVWQSSKADFKALENWFNEYLKDYQENKTQWHQNLASSLQNLAEILHLNDLLGRVPKQCSQLILIPHRFLHLLSLHALPVSRETWQRFNSETPSPEPTNPCVLDCFKQGVRYAPSCQLLQQAQRRERPNFTHLFAVQNPNNNLPFTDIEVPGIRHNFPPENQDILIQNNAQKSAIDDSRLRIAHCAHFSCHGYFNFQQPLLSALLLADSELPPPAPAESNPNRYQPLQNGNILDLDKCLTLADIFALDFRECRLVVLSACETGISDFKSISDEFISLSSGFLVAGSSSVVPTLWTVNDLSTSLLMIEFYHNLKAGLSVALALNKAQLWLRDVTVEKLQQWTSKLSIRPSLKEDLYDMLDHLDSTEQPPFRSHYHWAAFCATGQ